MMNYEKSEGLNLKMLRADIPSNGKKLIKDHQWQRIRWYFETRSNFRFQEKPRRRVSQQKSFSQNVLESFTFPPATAINESGKKTSPPTGLSFRSKQSQSCVIMSNKFNYRLFGRRKTCVRLLFVFAFFSVLASWCSLRQNNIFGRKKNKKLMKTKKVSRKESSWMANC